MTLRCSAAILCLSRRPPPLVQIQWLAHGIVFDDVARGRIDYHQPGDSLDLEDGLEVFPCVILVRNGHPRMGRPEVALESVPIVIGRQEDDLDAGPNGGGLVPVGEHRCKLATGGTPMGAHVKEDEFLSAQGIGQGHRSQGGSALEECPVAFQRVEPSLSEGLRQAFGDHCLGGRRKRIRIRIGSHPELV